MEKLLIRFLAIQTEKKSNKSSASFFNSKKFFYGFLKDYED